MSDFDVAAQILDHLSQRCKEDPHSRTGDDSVSDDRTVREEFLAGRIHANLDLFLGGYDSSVPGDDEDGRAFTLRNLTTGRCYLISVEEIEGTQPDQSRLAH